MNAISSDFLKPALLAAAHKIVARNGRIHMPGFLTDQGARILFEEMQCVDWRVALKTETQSYDISATEGAALDPAQAGALLEAVHARAAHNFQYLFDSFRVSDLVESGQLTSGPLASLFTELNSEPALAALRQLTGDTRIAYLDAQATRYRRGHFLAVHDDNIEGKHRLYAYVINLTPHWRADWGGLLQFLDGDGHVAEAYTPRWNAINILRVPQLHAVSVVAPFAPADRLSITGWMRSRGP